MATLQLHFTLSEILSYHFQKPDLYIRVLNVFIFTKEHQLLEQLSTSQLTNTDKTRFLQFLTQYHMLCKDGYDMSISTMEANSSKIVIMQWRNTIVAGEFNNQSLPELSKLFLLVIFKKYIDKALPSHTENAQYSNFPIKFAGRLEMLQAEFLDSIKKKLLSQEMFSNSNIAPLQVFLIDKTSKVIVFKHSFTKKHKVIDYATLSHLATTAIISASQLIAYHPSITDQDSYGVDLLLNLNIAQIISIPHLDKSLSLYCITIYKLRRDYAKLLCQSDIPSIIHSRKALLMYDINIAVYPFPDIDMEYQHFSSFFAQLLINYSVSPSKLESGQIHGPLIPEKTIEEAKNLDIVPKKTNINDLKRTNFVPTNKRFVSPEARWVNMSKIEPKAVSRMANQNTSRQYNQPSFLNNSKRIKSIASHSIRHASSSINKYITERIKVSGQPQIESGISSILSKAEGWTDNSRDVCFPFVNKLVEKGESFVNQSGNNDNLKEIEIDVDKQPISEIQEAPEKCIFPL